MNTPRYDLASGRQSRLWSSRLWILAALLGVVTLVHAVGVVHDDRAWRAELHARALATAEQHAERINERLQFLAADVFAPMSRNGEQTAIDLNALAAAQMASERCRCRTVLPIAEFFRVDVRDPSAVPSTNQSLNPSVLVRKVSGGQYSATTSLTDSALMVIARTDALRRTAGNSLLTNLTLNASLFGNAVATVVIRDSIDQRATVIGFVANAHTLMQTLFTVSMAARANDTSHTSPNLDTMSLQVGLNDSSPPMYGRVSGDRPFRATVLLHGPMDGVGLSVGLAASELKIARFGPRTDRVWALGLLLILTVLVLAIAVGTSRRETFLARARSDFIAGTSHDFRMPLAQILLAGETLQLRPEVGSDVRGNLTKSIVRETHRLIAMVENVLLYSRSGAVEMKPALQAVAVRDVFEDVRDAVQLAVEECHQTMVLEAAPELQVMADRHLLRQCLVNLADNAMKYGALNQTIRLGAHRHSNSLVHVWVDDSGPGIPELQRSRVFEPYERLTRDQASERAGSGLGLAVVYQIVKACRGRVWIETAPGGGTRCVIELASVQT